MKLLFHIFVFRVFQLSRILHYALTVFVCFRAIQLKILGNCHMQEQVPESPLYWEIGEQLQHESYPYGLHWWRKRSIGCLGSVNPNRKTEFNKGPTWGGRKFRWTTRHQGVMTKRWDVRQWAERGGAFQKKEQYFQRPLRKQHMCWNKRSPVAGTEQERHQR